MNKALLQQALDALQRVSIVDDDCDTLSPSLECAVTESIQALRTELAKPDPVPVAWRSWHDTYGVGYWDTFDEAELNCTEDAEPTELFTKEQL